jgi:N-acyl-D-amino-acid deacylase
MIVAPGFVDPHTHYDAQMCWDPLLTPSSWHGVTTVVLGNCGVGVAPCRPEDREKATWDLVNLEAIPYETLKQGLSWDWESFPEFMNAAERRGCGLNLAFLAPLAPLRRYVLGDAAMERPATPEEVIRIRALLREAMDHGAVGFSSTRRRRISAIRASRWPACRRAPTNWLPMPRSWATSAGDRSRWRSDRWRHG